MSISIIGAGYVGLITGACFADLGNKVICVDVIKDRVDSINKGEAPIYEEGLDELLERNVGENLEATTDLEKAVLETDITFICVGTPDKGDGSSDLSYVEAAARGVGKALKKKRGYHVIVVKSTVVPGTTDTLVLKAAEKGSGKRVGKDFGLCMNPEFLREGKAIDDFMKPDRIVIGAYDTGSRKTLKELYRGFKCPVLETDLRTAEMIKYASNAFLAAKISFINEIANICEKIGADVVEVARGIGLDHRIGPSFLNAGLGWGGSCFPKDVKAIVALAKENGYTTNVLESVVETNRLQALRAVSMLKKIYPHIKGKKVAIWGLAFKPGTDDIREAPSLRVIDKLVSEGAIVSAYDPAAMENTRKVLGSKVKYAKDAKECIKGADACIIVTEWDEFRVDPLIFVKNMKNPVVIDGRRILNPEAAKEIGVKYFGVGYGKGNN